MSLLEKAYRLELEHVLEGINESGTINNDIELTDKELDEVASWVANDEWLNEKMWEVMKEAIMEKVNERGLS